MREKANAKFGEALTLEQLLEMDGKPVWTKLLVENTGKKEGWTLIYNDDGYAAVQRWTQCPLWYKDYGKTWIAYAYPPVHIEREVWDPCEECVSCENCKHSVDYDYGEYKFCNQCVDNSNFIPNNFCQNCGRPLTDEAWDELEKRLGVYNLSKKFPKDCWGNGCPYFQVWEMSVDSLCCHCDLLDTSCEACDEDFSFVECPKPVEED